MQDFYDRWNRFAKDRGTLTVCRELTDKRRKWIRTRLKHLRWFGDFCEAIKSLPLGGDGWQPDLDWLVKNDHNMYRILEGSFDWRVKDDPALQKLLKEPQEVGGESTGGGRSAIEIAAGDRVNGAQKRYRDYLGSERWKRVRQTRFKFAIEPEEELSANGVDIPDP